MTAEISISYTYSVLRPFATAYLTLGNICGNPQDSPKNRQKVTGVSPIHSWTFVNWRMFSRLLPIKSKTYAIGDCPIGENLIDEERKSRLNLFAEKRLTRQCLQYLNDREFSLSFSKAENAERFNGEESEERKTPGIEESPLSDILRAIHTIAQTKREESLSVMTCPSVRPYVYAIYSISSSSSFLFFPLPSHSLTFFPGWRSIQVKVLSLPAGSIFVFMISLPPLAYIYC